MQIQDQRPVLFTGVLADLAMHVLPEVIEDGGISLAPDFGWCFDKTSPQALRIKALKILDSSSFPLR